MKNDLTWQDIIRIIVIILKMFFEITEMFD
jgi:hypothetical protein